MITNPRKAIVKDFGENIAVLITLLKSSFVKIEILIKNQTSF
jgi:hypothetical protein